MKSLLVVGAALAACGSPTRDGGPGDDTGAPDGGCSEAARQVYVLDLNNTVSTFTPPATFTDIGMLNCAQNNLTSGPFSMAVDRNAIAWVGYTDGTLYNVDLTQRPLTCTPTTWVKDTAGEHVFGMGFSTDSSGGATDTLYISGAADYKATTHPQLSRLDLTASPITADLIGSPFMDAWPELTGNALGELWGFFPSWDGVVQTKVGRIDKQTGVVDPVYSFAALTGEQYGYAFAFYGGTYYIFLAQIGTMPVPDYTSVYAMDESGTLAHTEGIPTTRNIVGAGVSTCAPVGIGR